MHSDGVQEGYRYAVSHQLGLTDTWQLDVAVSAADLLESTRRELRANLQTNELRAV
jgi:hypothetical protein